MLLLSTCTEIVRRMGGQAWWRLFVLVLAALVVPLAVAGPLGSLERAVMPGPVIEGHAKYENECEKCHSPFSKDQQGDLCAACHKEVRADIQEKKGFHGRSSEVGRHDCRVCHTEHKGRGAQVVLLDKGTFNHEQSDFPLKDSHARVACAACHKPGKKFREAPGRCLDCHKDVEPHKGKLGERCEVCHRETHWGEFVFDHARTNFPLDGKHQGVGCSDCHVNERYKGITKVCAECHANDDKHQGQYGHKCDNCHLTRGWHAVKFDHDRDTKFKLDGRHQSTSCNECHTGKDIYKEKLKSDCYTCHRLKDEHKGLYGKKCQDCHTTKGWGEAKFDHDKDTKFKLKGKHKKVTCVDCHPGDLFKDKAPTDCFGCHRQDDVHRGQQGKECQKCHAEDGWIKEVDFDHDLTKFPLLGAHATLACEECHTSTSFKDAKGNCLACHEADDVHKKRLGPRCERCHNSADWKLWVFDHDKQTKFPLDGAHSKRHCDACHTEPVEDKFDVPSDCYSCHARDDVHSGGYGRNCQRCHVTESFRKFTRLQR
jgi:hypothetical protein